MGGINLPPAWDITTGLQHRCRRIDTGSPPRVLISSAATFRAATIGDVLVANGGNGRDTVPPIRDWIRRRRGGYFQALLDLQQLISRHACGRHHRCREQQRDRRRRHQLGQQILGSGARQMRRLQLGYRDGIRWAAGLRCRACPPTRTRRESSI
jgi:hypothetical protein